MDMIGETIQLALAPVFVLVALGNIMNLLSSRLGRVVDRSRALQERHMQTEGSEHDMVVREIRLIDRRIELINRAILLMVLSGLSIGTVVALLFVQEFAQIQAALFIAAVFILGIGLLMWALILFLMETRVAAAALGIPKDYLELDRKL